MHIVIAVVALVAVATGVYFLVSKKSASSAPASNGGVGGGRGPIDSGRK